MTHSLIRHFIFTEQQRQWAKSNLILVMMKVLDQLKISPPLLLQDSKVPKMAFGSFSKSTKKNFSYVACCMLCKDADTSQPDITSCCTADKEIVPQIGTGVTESAISR